MCLQSAFWTYHWMRHLGDGDVVSGSNRVAAQIAVETMSLVSLSFRRISTHALIRGYVHPVCVSSLLLCMAVQTSIFCVGISRRDHYGCNMCTGSSCTYRLRAYSVANYNLEDDARPISRPQIKSCPGRARKNYVSIPSSRCSKCHYNFILSY
jgi:hypothetical protein